MREAEFTKMPLEESGDTLFENDDTIVDSGCFSLLFE